MSIKLIVGLGNPGQQYTYTRHNAGVWFVDLLSRRYNTSLKEDKNFFGLTARANIDGHDLRFLVPSTFMNLSGKATSALAKFYKINTDEILVAHDELDLKPGTIRLKQGGGHGGHNGLRDIVKCHANDKNFARLRIGIGHPGSAEQVAGFVLTKAPQKEQLLIDQAIDEAASCLPELLNNGMQKAMNKLNGFSASA